MSGSGVNSQVASSLEAAVQRIYAGSQQPKVQRESAKPAQKQETKNINAAIKIQHLVNAMHEASRLWTPPLSTDDKSV